MLAWLAQKLKHIDVLGICVYHTALSSMAVLILSFTCSKIPITASSILAFGFSFECMSTCITTVAAPCTLQRTIIK